MFVAASTECFASLTLPEALERLGDLEYSHVEIGIVEEGRQLRPSQVLADLDAAVHACRKTHRLTPVSYRVEQTAKGALYYEQFAACCRLAKATKVVQITVPSSELGTPFNEEIERLRELVRIASAESVRVGLHTEIGKLTENPDTAIALCDNVKGLGITLDPSHYTAGPFKGSYDKLFKYVYHIYLRDTSKDRLQVRIGQGLIEYGRLLSQLAKFDYDRALCVHILEAWQPEGVDHVAELRKLRLLLESLL